MKRSKVKPYWEVVVRAKTSYYESAKIEVILWKKGEKRIIQYGELLITDPEFEDKITTMKARALERASALEAVGA